VFNLTLKGHSGEDGGMAIWDGTEFVYKESNWGYWDLAKMFWRYGRSPLTVNGIVKRTVASFISLYSADFASYGPFSSLASFAAATNLTHAASMTASIFFESNSVSDKFVNELVAAATTVNYGTAAHKIHGLGALVSMAASGASAVKGGNRKIFENFVGRSGSTLKLGKGAKVERIIKLDAAENERLRWVVHAAEGSDTFDVGLNTIMNLWHILIADV
jgi:prenylcysteine oxidase/farnesylcysteine lyase